MVDLYHQMDLYHHLYEDDEFSCQMPGKKDYVSIAKGVVLCNLREMYTAFKEKYPNVKLRFFKFCTFQPKWCVLAGSSGTHSVCVCRIHQNAILLVDAINWDITYRDLTYVFVMSRKHIRVNPHSIVA